MRTIKFQIPMIKFQSNPNFQNFKRVLFFFFLLFTYGFLLLFVVLGAYSFAYKDRVFPGVHIANVNVGNWTREEVEKFFEQKNKEFVSLPFVFSWKGRNWTITGDKIDLGYDSQKMAEEAYQMGRDKDLLSNLSFRWNAFFNGISSPSLFHFNNRVLSLFLAQVASEVNISPIEGLFEFREGKVVAFKPSSDGWALDIPATLALVKKRVEPFPEPVAIELPIKMVRPKVPMEEADKLGIKELLGRGESYFKDSIPSRVYNISLGSSKFHGILISPGEIFSFNKNVGTISAYTGYKQAYVIEKGKTVLGDGGGVCQVSTTLFRAALNSGLPIVERVAHSYRVGYYEPPVGFDATVYDPSPDFRFKNDTGQYILIQTILNMGEQKLTFELYGTSDGRTTTLSNPVITSQTLPPPPIYQDDPTLPKGEEKRIDTAHPGATVYFTRKVERGGKELIDETFRSNYIPWAAVYLRGTKE